MISSAHLHVRPTELIPHHLKIERPAATRTWTLHRLCACNYAAYGAHLRVPGAASRLYHGHGRTKAWFWVNVILTPCSAAACQIYIAGLATVRDISLHEEYVQLGDNANAEDELDVRNSVLLGSSLQCVAQQCLYQCSPVLPPRTLAASRSTTLAPHSTAPSASGSDKRALPIARPCL